MFHAISDIRPVLDGLALKLFCEAKYLVTIFDCQLIWLSCETIEEEEGFIALYSCKNIIWRSLGLSPVEFVKALAHPLLWKFCLAVHIKIQGK